MAATLLAGLSVGDSGLHWSSHHSVWWWLNIPSDTVYEVAAAGGVWCVPLVSMCMSLTFPVDLFSAGYDQADGQTAFIH